MGNNGTLVEKLQGMKASLDSSETKRLVIRLDDVLGELKSHHPDADLDLVRKACFHSSGSSGQIRTNGGPVVHPLAVAYIVVSFGWTRLRLCRIPT